MHVSAIRTYTVCEQGVAAMAASMRMQPGGGDRVSVTVSRDSWRRACVQAHEPRPAAKLSKERIDSACTWSAFTRVLVSRCAHMLGCGEPRCTYRTVTVPHWVYRACRLVATCKVRIVGADCPETRRVQFGKCICTRMPSSSRYVQGYAVPDLDSRSSLESRVSALARVHEESNCMGKQGGAHA